MYRRLLPCLWIFTFASHQQAYRYSNSLKPNHTLSAMQLQSAGQCFCLCIHAVGDSQVQLLEVASLSKWLTIIAYDAASSSEGDSSGRLSPSSRVLPGAGGEAGMLTTACPAGSQGTAVVSRKPMEGIGLLGDARGGAGKEVAPDASLAVKLHAGGASEMRCCPAGTKDGAETRSRSGNLLCEAAHGPSEVADTAGSMSDSACPAQLEGCNKEGNCCFSCEAAFVLSNRGSAGGVVTAAACPAGTKGCAVGRSPVAWRPHTT